MSIELKERLNSSSLENLRQAAILEFTEEVFESDNYCSLEVLTPDEQQLYIVNRNDRTLTILGISKDMAVTKETLFTQRIISMKEWFVDYSMSDNTPPRKLEVELMGGRTLLIEPGLSTSQEKNYKKPEFSNQVNEDFEHLIAALKNTVIL
ncbi:hypothetical protein [Halobacillus sp. BBL2006]|uniref:hypothetical protein n=1 Tax=Halobacillus sp. BBL2006 TaxID=1543706 RepID=UPI000542FE32|nr:hypothetical protein [Halobacillus sp. BBL2006]KHE72322.1 hypothetical protein LD39_05160 [Halobacillus sp. BBL2006]